MSATDAFHWGIVIFLVGGAPFFLLIGYSSREIGQWLTRRQRAARREVSHPPSPKP